VTPNERQQLGKANEMLMLAIVYLGETQPFAAETKVREALELLRQIRAGMHA
jgi:hypothetical protein